MSESILYNADILTLDPGLPKARLVYFKNGIIRAVSREDRPKDYGSHDTARIDCGGKTLLPAFIDPHFHFHGFAGSFLALDVSPRNQVRSIADIQAKIREQVPALAPEAWIRAKGYNEFYLEEKRHPNRWDLDLAAPDHPVKLTHRSGHAHVLNSLGLKRTGITMTTPDPPGGLIDRDLETGEPTGLLFEMGDFLSKRIPPPDAAQFEQAVKKADRKLAALGITSIQDVSASNGPDQWQAFQSWIQRGALQTRLTMMIGLEAFDTAGVIPFTSSIDPNRLRFGGIKIILDETTGRLHPPQALLNEKVLKIHQSGQQVAIHAIEETAVEAACCAIEDALKKLPKGDHRHRIEHCSVCSPRLAERLASAGIWVVTQPAFLYFNGDRYLNTVPQQQLNYLYPFKSMMENGIAVAASSDSPIVPPDPFAGIYSAVSRCCETGAAIGKDETISVKDAIEMMTLRAAGACRQETLKGSISPGKLADMILVNRNPMKVPLKEIKALKIERTFRGGEIVEPDVDL